MTSYVNEDGSTKKDERERISHPAFGMIRVHRQGGGHGRMFGVDYPVQDQIVITVTEAVVEKDIGREWFYGGKVISEVAMSETQFARMITNPNASGIPCTLKHYRDGDKLVDPEPIPEHMLAAEEFKKKVQQTADDVMGNFQHVRNSLDELLAQGKAPTMKQMKEFASVLQQGMQGMTSDMPYYVRQLNEKADDIVGSAQIEIDAHIQNRLAELGRDALREKLTDESSRGGVLLRIGGKDVKKLPPPAE